ncbi:NAD(P)H-dependent flavin oxidoreductase [Geodermatophilus sp. SYSU D00766]
MRTRFTELVGCTVPVQQAPMGPVSPPDLAVAVADAGGVGTVTALGTPPEALLRRVDSMRERTQGALAVNVLTTDVDDGLLADLARRVRLVDFFWLDPSPRQIGIAHEAGALVNWQVGSLTEARAAVDAGCDLVTVQGIEAGGHVRGREPLLPLLRKVLDAVDVPVLAAGGISDGRALAAVLKAGADGARIGTGFIATTESGAHPAYRQAVVDATGDCTEITGAFATDCPLCATSARARVLRRAVERLAEIDDDVVARVGRGRMPVWCGSGIPPMAGAEGHVDAMAMYAGAGVGAVTEVKPAADVVAELVAHLERHDGADAAPDGLQA